MGRLWGYDGINQQRCECWLFDRDINLSAQPYTDLIKMLNAMLDWPENGMAPISPMKDAGLRFVCFQTRPLENSPQTIEMLEVPPASASPKPKGKRPCNHSLHGGKRLPVCFGKLSWVIMRVCFMLRCCLP